MASIEPTTTTDVVVGVNPDAVQVPVRLWRISPLRDRAGATVDDPESGLDLRYLGDPDADADPVTVITGLTNSTRNGAKRTYTEEGDPAIWVEPSPQTWDLAGNSSGILGTVEGGIQSAGFTIALGVASTYTLNNPATGFPLIVRPLINVTGARFESPQATLQALIDVTNVIGTTNLIRDLSYGYGGSYVTPLPAQTVLAGNSLTVDADLQLVYRADVAEAFEIAVAGCQVLLQITEYTSSS